MNNWPLLQLSQAYGIAIVDASPKNKILYVESDRGPLALKRSTLTLEELNLQNEIIRHLINNGYTGVAKIIPTLAGQGFARIGNELFMLTTWVKGVHADYSNPEHLDLAAKTLAKFHRAAMGYTGGTFWQKRKLYGVWPMRFSFRLNHLEWYRRCVAARGCRDEFDNLFMKHVDQALLAGYRVVTQLRTPQYYQLANQARNMGSICHHDYAYHNILIDENGSVNLIDFDYCLLDIPVHDLANMISLYVKYSKWCLNDISRILLMYHQEKPLLPAEIDALLCLLQFPQDFWQVAWAKYNELGMHKPESLLFRLTKLLENSAARQEFLTEFANLVRSKNFLPGRDTL